MRLHLSAALVFACLLVGCGDDGETVDAAVDSGVDAAMDAAADAATDTSMPLVPVEPNGYCPGGEGCEAGGDGTLLVGAAALDVTPSLEGVDVMTVDVNGNGMYEPSDGDEYMDVDGDGEFGGVWIAGFGNARPAAGVSDPQWARAIALQSGDVTLVLVSIDCVGFFHDDVMRVRALAADVDADYIMVSATHSHEARDTMGRWGFNLDTTGIDEDYMDLVREGAAEAARRAVADLRPANVQYATTRLRDQPGGTYRYVSDSRDPVILDDEIRIMRYVEAGSDTTIATLINFGSHPEYAGPNNTQLSSDFAHWLREGVESGVAGPDGEMVPGAGGIAVFYQGAVGSQIGPNDLEAEGWDGTYYGDEDSLELAQVIGEQLAYFVLDALRPDAGSVTEESADLGYRNFIFRLEVTNFQYHVAFLAGLFATRMGYDYDPDGIPGRLDPPPKLETEIAVIDVGRAQIVTIPGELDPALFLGGYDGSYTPEGVMLVDESKENPPDLTMAPPPPYLRDLAREDADYVYLFGLANDEIGYLIPSYDFELAMTLPWIAEAPGDHYEETNSPAERAWPTIEHYAQELLAWTP
jgi:hypothetical protein